MLKDQIKANIGAAMGWGELTPEEEEAWQRLKNNQQAINELRRANDKQVAGTHYKDMGVEPWDVVDTWPIEQRIGAYRHGALKYLMRCGNKDDRLQEIKKAGHYVEKLIEILQAEYPNADTGAT